MYNIFKYNHNSNTHIRKFLFCGELLFFFHVNILFQNKDGLAKVCDTVGLSQYMRNFGLDSDQTTYIPFLQPV